MSGIPAPQFENGPPFIVAAASTPGSALSCSNARLKKASICCACGYFFCDSERSTVSSDSVLNPSSACCNRKKLLISKPAPTNNTTDSATSNTTSAPRIRWPPASAREKQLPSLRLSLTRLCEKRSAGKSPHSNVVTNVRPSANNNTRASRRTLASAGSRSLGSQAKINFSPQFASNHPTKLASAANGRLSSKSWRINRPRPQQAGYVGAGNQQHEADGSHQHQQGWANVWPNRLAPRNDAHAAALIRFGILCGEPRGDDVEFSARLFQRHAGLQAAQGIN